MNQYARTIEDKEHKLSPAEILDRPATPEEFHQDEAISFGFTSAAHWFVIALNNTETTSLKRLLVFDPTWLDDVRVSLIGADGKTQEFVGGDNYPFGQRALQHRKINFEMDFPPGKNTLLIRTQTRDPYIVAMNLWERSAFLESDRDDALYNGILNGVLTVMLLYNLFLFLSVRESVYASYVFYIFMFLITHATYNGHTYPMLWPDMPEWGNWAHSIFIYIFLIAGLVFAINFLELKKRLLKAYRLLSAAIIFIASALLLTALGGYSLHVATSIFMVIGYSVLVLWAGAWSLVSGNRASRYFLIATTSGFIGAGITSLAVAGLIPYTSFTYRMVDFGMMIDAVLLSLALADRLKIARHETENAKAELLESTRSYAQRLEQTVEERTSELNKANAAKDKFLSIIGHDLRGPIGGLSSLFEDYVTTASEFNEETLNLARKTLKNINSLLEQLLTWARSQSGIIEFNPKPFDMGNVLAEMQELFSAQAKTKGIHLDLKAQESTLVLADLAMVRTVLRNLINNALKFTERGGMVRARISDENNYYEVRIIDTGIGMTQKETNALFRLDAKPQSSSGTGAESGTGLGLILCAEFVEKNGGSIGAQSEKGSGTVFWFTLPKASNSSVSLSDTSE